jgi:Ni/Co efflux regulator RcnB
VTDALLDERRELTERANNPHRESSRFPMQVTARAHTLPIDESGYVAKHERHRKGQQVGRENRSLGGCQAAQARMRGGETIDSEP